MSVSVHLSTFRDEIDACGELRIHALQSVEDDQARSMIYESVLLRAFRSFENYLEGVFLDYLVGEPGQSGCVVQSFASPKDLAHARKMVSTSASARFLDWSDPNTVRGRCEAFFEQDDPIYTAVAGKNAELKWMKQVRNHAAHNSVESTAQFGSVLRAVLLTEPSPYPSPGEFLQLQPGKGPIKKREILAYFLDTVRECGDAAAGISS